MTEVQMTFDDLPTRKPEVVRMTFDDLLARKMEREERAQGSYDIRIPGSEKRLCMTHPSAAKQLEVLDEIRHTEGIGDLTELYVRLIFDCCPVLRAKETIEGLGVIDPYDTVRTIFEPVEILSIGDEFCKKCGLVDTEEKAKN